MLFLGKYAPSHQDRFLSDFIVVKSKLIKKNSMYLPTIKYVPSHKEEILIDASKSPLGAATPFVVSGVLVGTTDLDTNNSRVATCKTAL